MNSKGHLIISLAKSLIRIFSTITSIITGEIIVLASGLLVAELLGIFEELVDKR